MRCLCKAFTLFELILVMLIVTIAMAIVAPSLGQFLNMRKSADAVNQILALARHARALALAEGKPYRLHVDTQTGEYWIEGREGSGYAEVQGDHGGRYRLPDDVKASWRADESAQAFPVNTVNQQSSSVGMNSGSGFGKSSGLGGGSGSSGGGLGSGGKSGLGGQGGSQQPGINNGGASNPRAMAAMQEAAVSFYPDGRNDALILTLEFDKEHVELGAWSETEPWGVMRGEEQ